MDVLCLEPFLHIIVVVFFSCNEERAEGVIFIMYVSIGGCQGRAGR